MREYFQIRDALHKLALFMVLQIPRLSQNIHVPRCYGSLTQIESIQKIVFTPSIHCYYLLSCFVISLEIKFDVFCVDRVWCVCDSAGENTIEPPLVFKNGWKIILMTGSCWECIVHFYTKTLNINIMLTFSTKRFDFAWNCIKKNCIVGMCIRVEARLEFSKKSECIMLDLNFWKNQRILRQPQVVCTLRPYAGWSWQKGG